MEKMNNEADGNFNATESKNSWLKRIGGLLSGREMRQGNVNAWEAVKEEEKAAAAQETQE